MMKNQNENLEKYISMLDNDVPLTKVLEQIEDNDENLSELISLAAKIRALPNVPIDQKSARKQDAIIHSIIESNTLREEKTIQQKISDWFITKTKPLVRIRSFVFILSLFFAIFLFFITVNQTSFARIKITQLYGQVEVVRSESEDAWNILDVNDAITAGQKIKTGSNSFIELELPDQSHVKLSEETEITIDTVSNLEKDGFTFIITQHTGSTHHQVVPLENVEKNYVINTPSNKIYVQGTNFDVKVASNGRTFIFVEEGLVNVIGADKEVTITPGFASDTIPGKTPSTPLHSFSSYGELLKKEGNMWEMSDMLFYVSDETNISRRIEPGEDIIVTGRILPNGNWLADSIENNEETEYRVVFTGIIKFISEELWVVDDKSVIVTNETNKPDNLTIGDLVRIVYINQNNGRRQAVQVSLLSTSENEKPNKNLPPKETKDVPSGLHFASNALVIEDCVLNYELTESVINTAGTQTDNSRNTTIDYKILKGEKFVKQVILEPSSWDEIPPGETTQFTMKIDLTEEWLSTNANTEIKLRINITENNTHPDGGDDLSITLRRKCDNNTPEPENQDPPEEDDTQSEDELPIDENVVTEVPNCVGTMSHPQGQQLANIYEVSYEEIMTWFCEGFGFGEIDLAYFYAQKAGESVSDIFVMVRDGMDWGEIITQLGLEK